MIAYNLETLLDEAKQLLNAEEEIANEMKRKEKWDEYSHQRHYIGGMQLMIELIRICKDNERVRKKCISTNPQKDTDTSRL